MKTILFKNIDGIDVVVGFRKLQINPIKTRENFDKKIKTLPEFKELEALSSDYVKYRYQKDVSKDELAKKLDKLKAKKEEINSKMGKDSDHIAYFEAKESERVLSDTEHDEYKSLYGKAVENNNYLSMDKTEIPNLKGKEYFIEVNGKLERKKIDKIGLTIPNDAILELSEAQKIDVDKRELSDKISKMSKDEIDAEYSAKKKKIIEQTQDRRTEFRLEGATAAKAESDAIAEFKPKLDKLKTDYNQI